MVQHLLSLTKKQEFSFIPTDLNLIIKNTVKICQNTFDKSIEITARYFDKDSVIPKYGLQYLRYYLGLNIDAVPHTALGDILVLEALFNRINAKAVVEFGDDAVSKMIEVSKNPVFYRRMPFGKHKALKMEEVPIDYLQWLVGTDLEEDLRYTVEQYLGAWG